MAPEGYAGIISFSICKIDVRRGSPLYLDSTAHSIREPYRHYEYSGVLREIFPYSSAFVGEFYLTRILERPGRIRSEAERRRIRLRKKRKYLLLFSLHDVLRIQNPTKLLTLLS